MGLAGEKVSDGRVPGLICTLLGRQILEDGALSTPEQGSPQGSALAPPTKVQNSTFASFPGKKGEVDAVDDADLVGFDQDTIVHRAEDLLTHGLVGLIQVRVDGVRKAVQASQRFSQRGLLACLSL